MYYGVLYTVVKISRGTWRVPISMCKRLTQNFLKQIIITITLPVLAKASLAKESEFVMISSSANLVAPVIPV
jgi:hypothetical protein